MYNTLTAIIPKATSSLTMNRFKNSWKEKYCPAQPRGEKTLSLKSTVPESVVSNTIPKRIKKTPTATKNTLATAESKETRNCQNKKEHQEIR